MLRSFLIGLVAGQRGMTPLAVIATASRRREIPADLPLQTLMLSPVIAAGTVAMAAAEMAGDKMKTAPDRTVPIGLAVRSVTAAYAGAALAPRNKRALGAAIAVGTALASSYAGLAARKWAMRRYGQSATGFVEDAIVFGCGLIVANPTLVTRSGTTEVGPLLPQKDFGQMSMRRSANRIAARAPRHAIRWLIAAGLGATPAVAAVQRVGML